MKRFCFVVCALMVAISPAHAHLLKVFATVEGKAVSGYGFFVGGGRPEEATLIITDKDGHELYRGKTDTRGAFSWSPPEPQALMVTVDAGDGHVAHRELGADRFDVAQAPGETPAPDATPGESAVPADAPASAPGSLPSNLDAMITAAVDKAVARQIRPLMEAVAEADGRARFNDVIGGVGMIFGLAGAAMWIVARRRIQAASRPDNQ